MGKKRSWFSALKKAFLSPSKETDVCEKEKKKWGLGKTKHREINTFLPLYTQPSSIEKILGDTEREQKYKTHQMAHGKVQQSKAPTTRSSAKYHTSTNTYADKAKMSKTVAADFTKNIDLNKENTNTPHNTKAIPPGKQAFPPKKYAKNHAHIAAIKIQAACRGYMLLTVTPKTSHAVLSDVRSGGFPWWWNWLEHQIPSDPQHQTALPPPTPKTQATTPTASTALLRPGSRRRTARTFHSNISSNRWQTTNSRPAPRDDESLTSCPAFTAPPAVPNYMTPTVSAKAKVKITAEDGGGVRGREGRRRFSFVLSQSIGSLRLFSAMKDADPPKRRSAAAVAGRHRSSRSIGELSVDSAVSLPAGMGRTRFK